MKLEKIEEIVEESTSTIEVIEDADSSVELVEEVIEDSREESKQILGDSLPLGLTLKI